MYRLFTIALTAVIFSASMLFALPAQASPQLHWRNGQTVCVDLPSSRASYNWQLRQQVSRWNALPDGPRLVIRSTCNWLNSIKIRIQSKYSNAQGVAYQSYDWDTGRLEHVDVKLNPYAVKLFPRWQRGCLRAWAASHEIAHGLGLEHWPFSHYGNVLAYNGWLRNCGRPQWADQAQFNGIYR